ncbi:TetR/AcrR family transcriptional regulator [Paenibacillus methanolicus]|uniref:AcrR family transcriptional regulator n=1 Tax=Paenibacillus methanolicus TaxID=582686 RepID=A0A5S5C5D2_9BACL|nr:TetR/AcrR family transcriptional regulator [Paenibacillus methanolicus]TYP74641.1 AcrR family transcriptional regulator [Paenibacillus methanolicus]
MPKIIVTEEQWIQSGIRRFSRDGIDGLVIERMASELGCSKSSFYWYFNDRSEFIAKIVDHWAHVTTQQVMNKADGAEQSEERMIALLTQMFSATRMGDFLFYLRKLGRDNPTYDEVLEQIERTRMEYARQLLIQTGMDPEIAEHKSSLLYHYYLGWYERHKHHPVSDDERNRHIDMLRRQLLGI